MSTAFLHVGYATVLVDELRRRLGVMTVFILPVLGGIDLSITERPSTRTR